MKKLLLAVCLLAINTSALAFNTWSTMNCTGTDSAGRNVYVIATSGSSYVNINGDNHLIVGVTQDGQGVVTKSFIATNGVLVYDSLVPAAKSILHVYQFNAFTHVLLVHAKLSCLITANSPSMTTVSEQSIFKAIKK